MNTKFVFTYWVGKILTLGALLAPFAMQILPAGWENITLGVALHFVVDYLNQYYHSA